MLSRTAERVNRQKCGVGNTGWHLLGTFGWKATPGVRSAVTYSAPVALRPVSSAEPTDDRQQPATAARTTAARLLQGQGLAVLTWAGVLFPAGISGAAASAGRLRVVVTLLVLTSSGAAALLIGTGLRRSMRGGRPAGLAVQAALLALVLQSHAPVLIAVAAAVTVVTGAVLLSPALARPSVPHDGRTLPQPPGEPRPDSAGAPDD
jgi:hypothetical protein